MIKRIKAFYWWLDKSHSILSHIILIILAWLTCRYVIYPLALLIAGTTVFPIGTVISGSMEHHPSNFNIWWYTNGEKYNNNLFNITKEEFSRFPFNDGINTGDLIVMTKATNVKVGDVVLYNDYNVPHPIIHRVVNIIPANARPNNPDFVLYGFEGDNNPYPDVKACDGTELVGKTVLVVPKIGWVCIVLKMPFVWAWSHIISWFGN